MTFVPSFTKIGRSLSKILMHVFQSGDSQTAVYWGSKRSVQITRVPALARIRAAETRRLGVTCLVSTDTVANTSSTWLWLIALFGLGTRGTLHIEGGTQDGEQAQVWTLVVWPGSPLNPKDCVTKWVRTSLSSGTNFVASAAEVA
jgi:hypothetical protein